MSMHTYVGARYVPRFTGEYDATQQYDALDIVDNGAGTSYIARKPVPINTPLTDTEYWFVYGASSGAIIQIQNDLIAAQNDIDQLESAMSSIDVNIDDLQNDVSELQSDLAALRTDMTSADEHLQDEIDSASADITALNSQMSTAQGNISTLQGQMSTAQGNISTLQGQMSTAQGNISTLQGQMSTANSNISGLRTDVDALKVRAKFNRVVLFTDSYGQTRGGVTPFTEILRSAFSSAGVSYEYYATSGLGITPTAADSGGLVHHIQQNWYSLINTPNTVSDIVIAMGANDIGQAGQLDSYISQLVSYLRTKFPNARIHLGFIGNAYTGSITDRIAACDGYKNGAARYGCDYLTGVEIITCDRTNLQVDNIHPSTIGATNIANGVIEALFSGSYIYKAHRTTECKMDGSTSKMTFNFDFMGNTLVISCPAAGTCDGGITFSRSNLTYGTFDNVIVRGDSNAASTGFFQDSSNHIHHVNWGVLNQKCYMGTPAGATTLEALSRFCGQITCDTMRCG